VLEFLCLSVPASPTPPPFVVIIVIVVIAIVIKNVATGKKRERIVNEFDP
jgi:hypothetical protein